MKKDMLISVVVVVRNASAVLPQFLREVSAVLSERFKDYEIVVVDDASRDGTAQAVQLAQKELSNIQLYTLSRRSGLSVATIAGLDNAIGDYMITMDILRDPVAKIPEMIERAVEGADIVYAVDDTRAVPKHFHDRAAVQFYKLFTRLTGIDIPQEASGFRLLSRGVVNYITAISDRHHLLKVLPAITGYTFAVVPYQAAAEAHERKPNLFGRCEEAMGILFSSSAKPLRFATYAALLAGAGNLLYALYVVVVALIKPDVAEGWVSLSLQSSAMFFLISLVLTIISEYLYGIMERTQNHPLYHITRESSSTVFRRKEELNVVEKA